MAKSRIVKRTKKGAYVRPKGGGKPYWRPNKSRKRRRK